MLLSCVYSPVNWMFQSQSQSYRASVDIIISLDMHLGYLKKEIGMNKRMMDILESLDCKQLC